MYFDKFWVILTLLHLVLCICFSWLDAISLWRLIFIILLLMIIYVQSFLTVNSITVNIFVHFFYTHGEFLGYVLWFPKWWWFLSVINECFSFFCILINLWCQSLIISFGAGEMLLYYGILICISWLPMSLGIFYNFTSYSSFPFYNFHDCII